MNTGKVFKNLIIVQFALLVIIINYSILSPHDEGTESTFSNAKIALLVVGFASYINYFLLLIFKPIGKVLFIPILLVMYTLGFSIGNDDGDNFTLMFDTLSTLIHGMVIAMLYFTEIKNKFISS